MNQFRRDVYGPAEAWDVLIEGTTIGTSAQFVHFAIGFEDREHLLVPDEADRLAELLREAAAKCRDRAATAKAHFGDAP